jgi:hypothetical protein
MTGKIFGTCAFQAYSPTLRASYTLSGLAGGCCISCPVLRWILQHPQKRVTLSHLLISAYFTTSATVAALAVIIRVIIPASNIYKNEKKTLNFHSKGPEGFESKRSARSKLQT